jgi:hypothetical protein
MATTYKWNCKIVDAYPTYEGYADVVYNIHWSLTANSDKLNPEGNPYSATSIGSQILDVSDIKNFIPFNDLTEAEVQAWTESALGVDKVAELKARLDNQIDLEINPPSIQLTIGVPVSE